MISWGGADGNGDESKEEGGDGNFYDGGDNDKNKNIGLKQTTFGTAVIGRQSAVYMMEQDDHDHEEQDRNNTRTRTRNMHLP